MPSTPAIEPDSSHPRKPRRPKRPHRDAVATAAPVYVVTFNPAPVVGVGALAGLRRMTLADAHQVIATAARIPKRGRIIDAGTLRDVTAGTDAAPVGESDTAAPRESAETYRAQKLAGRPGHSNDYGPAA